MYKYGALIFSLEASEDILVRLHLPTSAPLVEIDSPADADVVVDAPQGHEGEFMVEAVLARSRSEKGQRLEFGSFRCRFGRQPTT